MTDHEEWLATHKGEYLYTVGMIWECGDDDCRCEQAQVIDYYANKRVRGVVPIVVWEGTFTTADSRADGDLSPDAQLAAYRLSLRLSDPEREAAIRWQEGIQYIG